MECISLKNVYQTIRAYTIDHKFGKSIVGRVVACAGLEVLGGFAGSYKGAPVFGTLMKRLCSLVPIAVGGIALYGLRKRTALAVVGILGVSMVAYSQSWRWEMFTEAGYAFGGWLGARVGMVLGGYAGLRIAESDVPFWDHTVTCDSYLVGMTKFLIAGEIFEQVIAKAAIPYLGVPINAVRALCGAIVKTCAYNSSAVLHIFKSLVREKKFNQEVVLPFFVKTICSKYCQRNAAPITDKLIDALSRVFKAIPNAEYTLKILLQNLISNYAKENVEKFGGQTDKLATILMRAFPKYVDLIQSSQKCVEAKNIEDLKRALKEEIWGAKVSSWVVSPMAKSSIPETAKSFLESVQQIERDLVGFQLTKDIGPLQPYLTIHIKYFLIYVLQNYDASLLTAEEEKLFFQKLVGTFFSLYNKPILSHQVASQLGRILNCSVSAFFFFKMHIKHLIEQPEERAIAIKPLVIMDEYKQLIVEE